MRCSTTSPIRARCASTFPAISLSWRSWAACVRAGGPLFSARRSGHAAQRGEGVTLLQVDGASKRFGSLIAIDDVSLAIEPGELRAIIGPNGAGKTTFFNLVSG